MREMAQANLAEIATANLALQQSQSDQVKAYAQKMIDDHTQAQKELEQLAQSKGVTLPTEPDRKHQAMAKKLQALEGEKFDKQYMSQGGVKDHRETHRMLSRAQGRVKDPDLQVYITKVTPIVGGHMKLAQDAQSGKGTASGSSASGAGKSGATDSSGASGGASGSSGTSGSSGVSGTSGSSNSTGPGK